MFKVVKLSKNTILFSRFLNEKLKTIYITIISSNKLLSLYMMPSFHDIENSIM